MSLPASVRTRIDLLRANEIRTRRNEIVPGSGAHHFSNNINGRTIPFRKQTLFGWWLISRKDSMKHCSFQWTRVQDINDRGPEGAVRTKLLSKGSNHDGKETTRRKQEHERTKQQSSSQKQIVGSLA